MGMSYNDIEKLFTENEVKVDGEKISISGDEVNSVDVTAAFQELEIATKAIIDLEQEEIGDPLRVEISTDEETSKSVGFLHAELLRRQSMPSGSSRTGK